LGEDVNRVRGELRYAWEQGEGAGRGCECGDRSMRGSRGAAGKEFECGEGGTEVWVGGGCEWGDRSMRGRRGEAGKEYKWDERGTEVCVGRMCECGEGK